MKSTKSRGRGQTAAVKKKTPPKSLPNFRASGERRAAPAQPHERLFELLVDSVGDCGIFMLDPNGMVASWNTGAERIKGYAANEIIGRHFSHFYTQEDKQAHKPERELEIATETGIFHEEGWRVRKDGSPFWASVVIRAVRGDLGELIGFAKVTRDLTEQRLSEERAAEASRVRDEILKNAPNAIVAVDLSGLITAVNPAFESMLCYKPEQVVGIVNILALFDPRELEARAAELSTESGSVVEGGIEVITYRPSRSLIEEREWTFRRKDGSNVPVSLLVGALQNSSGRISGYLGTANDITERKRREDYTTHVAYHDFLTGLPNRMLLADRLGMTIEQAQRSHQKVAVLMLDLDHFKRVNDSLGHQIGDELLQIAAERIKTCTRAMDTVARMGGDEFVVVLGRIEEPADAERVAAKIAESLRASVSIGSHELMVTASIGISYFPQDGDNAHLLLKNADSAMYLAKAEGRNSFRAFNHNIPRLAQERLDVEHGISRALRDGLFALHYQPQVCLESGEVTGMEALLRWIDPMLGEVLPDQFIPIAEECGLIVPLGEWVIRTACAEAKQLQRRTGRPLRLAVNLSPRQFQQINLPEVIRSALEESGLAAECLELEITERVFMANTDQTISHLEKIRGLGASIAIDDFGIGFSSLSYLTRFPIDTLKIDRNFVSGLPHNANDAAVVQSIIALATSLGIKLVAEGVETRQQLDFLRLRSCGSGRGGYLGDPVPAGKFNAQGFCFSKAVSVEAFALGFHALQTLGTRSIADITH